EVVIWRSLRDAPGCEALLDDCLQVLMPVPGGPKPVDLDQRLKLLLQLLREQRALIVLDNLEVLLEEGETTGQMRSGFEDYNRLLNRVGQSQHRSCLVFTSREKPVSLGSLEGMGAPVRLMSLARLESSACDQLLAERDISGTDSERARLVDLYDGNPL